MTPPLIPRLDALPDAQRRLWPMLQPLVGLGFVLYGGTAISLRLGHRQSVDFDFTSLDTARALVEALGAGAETQTLPFPAYRQG